MGTRHALRRWFWRTGYDLCKFTPAFHPIARRKRLLEVYNIDTVLDIGANRGQFAQELRIDMGFRGRIISFEPLSAAFELLQKSAAKDPAWKVLNFAIGDTEGNMEINISGNSVSSSLLNMLDTHLHSAPNSGYVGKELVAVRTIDSLFGAMCKSATKIFMKIDTQGYESKVLKGAEMSLEHIDTVQLEMSLIPLYEGEILFDQMSVKMGQKGYKLVAIENGFANPDTGQLLQVDAIFHR